VDTCSLALNIGLNRSGLPANTAGYTLRVTVDILGAHLPVSFEHVTSGDEPTLVVFFPTLQSGSLPVLREKLHALCAALGQDCVAALWSRNNVHYGELVGPRADRWGAFNAAYFTLPTFSTTTL
jgi:hypothetical protein